VIVRVVGLPGLVCRAIPCHNNGRLVVASVCRLGIARRVYSDHRL
jgi:hypothetical protein